MENVNINYSINNIRNTKTIFEANNKQILENLKSIEKEYSDMSSVLSTPNSNIVMPKLSDMLRKYDDNVTKNGLYFERVFNAIIKGYDEFTIETEDKVRGDK